jgi:hypothetical protein
MTEHYLEFIASIAVATRPVMLVGIENMNGRSSDEYYKYYRIGSIF